MLFLLICTEGKVSEPEYLGAFVGLLKGQQPQSGENFVDVITLSMEGNQGHLKLVESADSKILNLESDEDQPIHYAEESDMKEKWLVCDYDELGQLDISLEEFYELCNDSGYTLIMNKPNFEYFILALLAGWEIADSTKDIKSEINNQIDLLNKANKDQKGFTDSMAIPAYSKKTYVAREIFGKILNQNPELVWEMSEKTPKGENYSDMPILLKRLKEVYGINR